VEQEAKSFGDDFTIYLIDDSPKTITEAFSSPDADDWKEAVRSEMNASQKEAKDFFDTYSTVARLTTIYVLLSLSASHGLLIYQMDVKIAFLNGELEEKIYMT
jgi:hypothetical protein